MSIDLCKEVYPSQIEQGDELDFDGDEYCDNESAVYDFAKVFDVRESVDSDGDLVVTLSTSQGTYDVPGNHLVKLKIQE